MRDAGLVDKFRPISAVGSCEWSYRLTRRGWELLVHTEQPVGEQPYKPAMLSAISYTEHDLQINALVLSLAQRIARPARGGLLERMPFTWHGPRRGRIDPKTEPRPPEGTLSPAPFRFASTR